MQGQSPVSVLLPCQIDKKASFLPSGSRSGSEREDEAELLSVTERQIYPCHLSLLQAPPSIRGSGSHGMHFVFLFWAVICCHLVMKKYDFFELAYIHSG